MSHIFQTGGALLADSAVYIERKADTEAIAHLRQMDYLLVIESRQQGKTSLLARLRTNLESSRYVFAYVDVEDLNYESEQAWFADLWGELSWGMGSALLDAIPSPPVNCQGWREQVRSLAQFAHKRSFQVIIALDEVGSMSKAPWAEQFFAGLRKFYNQRAFLPFCQKLTFILSGAFHPRDLISDDKISPFNVAQRVRLLDFTAEQVRELVGKGNWSEEQATTLAERIHYWTDGQPYLAQLLCSYLGPDATPADVDANVERLRREDENHLPPILEQLNRDEKLCWYVGRVVTGKRIKFYPREHRRQAQLELLGVIKGEPEGYCIVRNRIYEQVLASTSDGKGSSPTRPVLPFELDEALTRRTLALFLGADLPRAVTGLPSRADLARGLAHRHGLDDSLSLAEVAQRVSQAGNRWAFTAFIREALDTAGKPPQPFHRRIVELVKTHQIETLVTIAYDNLLELAFQEAGSGISRVVRGSDVHFIRPSRPTLIKLYGDAQQPDTLVVTDRDHSDLLRDREREPLLDEVRRAFRRNTVLFLGYNLSDPDFRFLFDQIAESRFARTAYAVWPGLPEADVQMWRDRGIVILDADPLGVLDTLPETPAAQGAASPEIPVANSEISSELGGEMDYERGLGAFKQLAQGTDWYQDFAVQEARLHENLRDERRYGPSEQTRRDRTRIVDQLNALALEHLGLSFNDLCLGQSPPPKPTPSTARERKAEATSLLGSGNAQPYPADQEGLERALRMARRALAILEEQAAGFGSLHVPAHLLIELEEKRREVSELEQHLTAHLEGSRPAQRLPVKGDDTPSDSTDPNPLRTGNRWAVLVGVNHYDDANYGQLSVCVKDVHAIREQLIAGGFEPERIRLLTDDIPDDLPTRANILSALKSVADAAEPDDLLLFYYSGHGDDREGESYLVARDGRFLVLGDTAVPVSRVKEIVEQAPARAKVIVLDACHSGADIGGKGPRPMAEGFIRRVFEQAEGLAILASCKQGQLSYEWRAQERSVFTHFLLEALEGRADRDEKGFVTVQDASRHVTNGVKLWASQRDRSQTPSLQAAVAGDIILVRYS